MLAPTIGGTDAETIMVGADKPVSSLRQDASLGASAQRFREDVQWSVCRTWFGPVIQADQFLIAG